MAPRQIGQEVDYLGIIGAKLRDLTGYETLAHELIQNADDALKIDKKPAQWICFDIREDCLIVENDGIFTDCGDCITEEICAWKNNSEIDQMCDFHRFRRIASGDKRFQEDTTGAFGIGFISVYQITDSPILISNEYRWEIHPDRTPNKRIDVWTPQDDGWRKKDEIEGTRFIFPWARKADSTVRRLLRVPSVDENIADTFFSVLLDILPKALLFLRHINAIELKRNGKIVTCITRAQKKQKNQVEIRDGDQTSTWYVLQGNFESEANRLKDKYPTQIEKNKESTVTIAIPQNIKDTEGILCAYLPTQQPTGLPIHINADFFTSSDRKSIILRGYQEEWNRYAIQTAAEILCTELLSVRDYLEPQALWELIQRIKSRYEEKNPDFASPFWEQIQETIKDQPIVYTSQQKWIRPIDGYIPGTQEEEKVIPIFEDLDLPIVHPNLRPFYTLLIDNDIGVKNIVADDLAEHLFTHGITDIIPLKEAPIWLQSHENRKLLCWEIQQLLGRNIGNERRQNATVKFSQCTLILGQNHKLYPPKDIFRSDKDTEQLFKKVDSSLEFVHPTALDNLLDLVRPFSLEDAIACLEDLDFSEICRQHPEEQLPISIITWFARPDFGDAFAENKELRRRFANLKIIPTGRELKMLKDVDMPGSFEDPLHIASIIDMQHLQLYREFLENVGAHPLTLISYVMQHVPNVFENETAIPDSARHQLVQILSSNLSELQDDKDVLWKLQDCSLVACTDGKFRTANKVYFDKKDIRIVLGNNIPLVQKNLSESVHNFYRWLGVKDKVTPSDLLRRIKKIILETPSQINRSYIQKIFEHLTQRWAIAEDRKILDEGLQELKTLNWLPKKEDDENWHAPQNVYTDFRRYLFESQELFLDIPRPIQQDANNFIPFLNIPTEPSINQVVRHLLSCMEKGSSVNKQVYDFLNTNSDQGAITLLLDKACLLIDNDTYIKPSHAFWGEHGFGDYRFQLSSDWRIYTNLLNRLGVKDVPDSDDAKKVLLEISNTFPKKRLEGRVYSVVMNCWKLLSSALEQDDIGPEDLQALAGHPIIPNPRRLLDKPEHILFEDRPGLAKKFEQLLKDNVIHKTPGTWYAMEAVGVRRLSHAVEKDLIICESPQTKEDIIIRLQDRLPLIKRVVEEDSIEVRQKWNFALLDILNIQEVTDLKVSYRIEIFNQNHTTPPESEGVFWDAENHVLYYKSQDNRIPWAAICRELSFALNPDVQVGHIASVLKDILSSTTIEEANEILDDLGYARLQKEVSSGPTGDVVGTGGTTDETLVDGEDTPEPDTPEPDIPEPDTPEPDTPEPDTPEPDTPEPDTPEPDTPEPDTPEPDTPPKRQGGTYPVFVRPPREVIDPKRDPKPQEQRKKTDDAGIEYVKTFELRNGRLPQVKPHNNPGYDILSKNEEEIRYIEVKSLTHGWSESGVALSKTQFEFGKEKGDEYWLYIVEEVGDGEPILHRIQNPAELANKFHFNSSWNVLSEGHID